MDESGMNIKFGTDGWRGVISDDFTFANARIVAQAIADYLLDQQKGQRGIVIGYDARFLSARYAEEVARVIAANGIKVFLSNKVAATPVVSFAVKNLRAGGGLMITASHNPADYNGIKFKGEYGGSALPEMTAHIEKLLRRTQIKTVPLSHPLIHRFDADADYLNHLRRIINRSAISAARFRVVVDPMHGAGRGYLRTLLKELGIEVVEIRGEPHPSFGGINPEPIPPNLAALSQAVLRYKAQVGLATDGDADRMGAVDDRGEFVTSHYIYALILRHLVEERGWQGGVAKTFSTTLMIDRLAQKYGLRVFETPIGFKYICELFLEEADLFMGGEESGGFTVRNHIPERDGILASLLLLEVMAVRKQNLRQLVQSLKQEIGSFYYERVDLPISGHQKETLMGHLQDHPPKNFGPLAVVQTKNLDGLKFMLESQGWILFRPSGTEPMVRIYVEADSEQKVKKVLEEGQKIYYRARRWGRLM